MKEVFILGILTLCAATYLGGQIEVDTGKNEILVEHLFFETNTDVYKVAEEMPRFPGCEELATKQQKEDCSMRKMLEFFYGNLKVPAIAREGGYAGRVMVEFIVEKDGTITDAKVTKDPGGGWGEEALRVLSLMPGFVPGKQHGEAVRVWYQLPLRVHLE